MIGNINFTGRETMLTSGLKKAEEKTIEVIKASSVLPETMQKAAVKLEPVSVYTSPYAPVSAPVKQTVSVGRNGLNFFA